MALGYDVYDDSSRSFDQKGLTGDVKRYTTASMSFPCLIVLSTPEKPVKRHNLETLHMMLPKSKLYDEEAAKSMINVYFNQGGKTAKLGVIQPKQVKTVLQLFKDNDVDGYLSRDEKLEGMYLYVLSE